mmetsp:Transcript_47938/g.48813  ORF Transcript_47938/g.48813 Transcript_47938/m.48813 type:complete len:99 (-) Transcript_47938:100-396(-)
MAINSRRGRRLLIMGFDSIIVVALSAFLYLHGAKAIMLTYNSILYLAIVPGFGGTVWYGMVHNKSLNISVVRLSIIDRSNTVVTLVQSSNSRRPRPCS